MEYKSGKHEGSRNHGKMYTCLSLDDDISKTHLLFLWDEYGSCYTDIALILKEIELEYRRLGLGCVKLL